MRYRRTVASGCSYFFTVVLEDRSTQLLTQQINALRGAFHQAIQRNPFVIDAVVILPDHFHMIMTLHEDDRNYSEKIGFIKSAFSRQIEHVETVKQSKKAKRERGIWQRRFWEHAIRNEKDYSQHMDYIHYNPVKHGYVKTPAEWQYSSIHRYIKMRVIPPEWGAQYEVHTGLFGE